MSILDEIFTHKRLEVAERQRHRTLAQVRLEAEQAAPGMDFLGALRSAPRKPALIAEVKRASPSRGLLVKDFDPLRLAAVYQQNGAAAISVLTDERFFQGSLNYLRQIADMPGRPPLLRKDFLLDPYQVFEARAAGADAVLLIAAYLEPALLRDLHTLARELGMTPLVEVHTREELDAAAACDPVLVGVNNRNLHDFTVNLETSLSLRAYLPPDTCMVAESGIHTSADIQRLTDAGIDAILVGEALVTAGDVAAQVRAFSGRVEREAI